MQMTQIPQRRPILITHPLRKPRITQPLIPRRFRHILQHPQPRSNRLLPVRRHLTPLWQHIVFHVIPLLRRHPVPHLRTITQHLLLRRRHLPQPILVLQNPLPVRRRHIPPPILSIRRLLCRRTIRIRIYIRIYIRIHVRLRTRNRLHSAARTIRAVSGIRRSIVVRILPRRCLWGGLRSVRPMLRRNHRSRQRQHQHRRERSRPNKAQPAPPLTEFAHQVHRKNSRLLIHTNHLHL
jgi:hypothetical protein